MIMMSRTIFMTLVSVTVCWLSSCCPVGLPTVLFSSLSLVEAFAVVSSPYRLQQRYGDHHHQPSASTQAGRAPAPFSFSSLAATTKPKGQTKEEEEEGAAAASNVTAKTNTTARKTSTTRTTYEIKKSSRLKNVKGTTLPGKEWDIYMKELKRYNRTHGTVNVPYGSKDFPKLSEFVRYVRRFRTKLTKQQKDALEKLGFIWEGAEKVRYDQKWNEMFLELKEYQNKTGNTLVSAEDKDNAKLRRWVTTQRHLYTNDWLNEERTNMLELINFTWSVRPHLEGARGPSKVWENRWQKRFKELIAFKKENNHTNVPKEYKENKPLARWVYRQRKQFSNDKLCDDRRKLLDGIGFIWDFENVWESTWQKHFEEYKIATRNKSGIAPYLLRWATNQRLLNSNNRLDAKRKEKLDEINVDWNFSNDRE